MDRKSPLAAKLRRQRLAERRFRQLLKEVLPLVAVAFLNVVGLGVTELSALTSAQISNTSFPGWSLEKANLLAPPTESNLLMIDLRQNIIKWLSENIAKSFTDENICEKKKKKNLETKYYARPVSQYAWMNSLTRFKRGGGKRLFPITPTTYLYWLHSSA